MNIENAKKLRLPDAQKIIEDLEKSRKLRIQERQAVPVSAENYSSDSLGGPTVDNSKGTPNKAEPPKNEPREQSNPRPSAVTYTLRRICCCFKAYRVIPDATITIEK